VWPWKKSEAKPAEIKNRELMKISIILAHPNPDSFNHAIASTAADTLRRNGHQVILHDLCQEQFPPLLSAAELRKDAKLEPIVD
jgi:putative NADPH-quinone reductase